MSAYAWMDNALCAQADPDQWAMPVTGGGRVAQRICGSCPVAEACAQHAQTLHTYDGLAMHGTWGGHSRKHRLDDRRQNAKEAA